MRLRRGRLAAGVALAAAATTLLALELLSPFAAGAWATYTGRSVAVYLTIYNPGPTWKCVVGARVAEPVEGVRAEIHATVEERGVYRMVPLERLCVPPFSAYALRPGPGGAHVMVVGPAASIRGLVADGVVELALLLEGGGELRVRAPVRG